MASKLVLGEAVEDIVRALGQVNPQVPADGSARWSGDIDHGAPLARALMRAEAELLVADAAAMQFGTYDERTPRQRRHDAMLLILHRLAEHDRAA